MRISDWSSDVCSSDLPEARCVEPAQREEASRGDGEHHEIEKQFSMAEAAWIKRHRHAGACADVIPPRRDLTRRDAKPKRGDSEIMAANAEQRRAEEQRREQGGEARNAETERQRFVIAKPDEIGRAHV